MAIGIAASTLLSGCTSTSAIKPAQRFGAMAAQFRDDTNKIADDIYDSCIRRVQFYRIDSSELRRVRDQAWEACERLNKPAAARTRDANQVAVDYIETIGRLSSDEAVAFNIQLDKIGSSLKSFSIPIGAGGSIRLPSSAVDTGMQIAGFIANWAASNYRSGKLSEAITCTDQPFQSYTKGLSTALQEGYVNGILNQELQQAQFYFDDYAALAKVGGAKWNDFIGLSKDSYNAVLPVVQRRNAALSYISIIGRTAQAHADLAKIFLNRGEPRTPESAACTAFFAKSVASAGSNLKSTHLGTNNEITPYQAAQVNMVLLAYHNDVKPLFKKMNDDLNRR